MFNLLLIIISYGSLLVLLMPATGTGIMLTAVIFALGIVLIVLKKDRIAVRKPTKKNKLHRLAFFSFFVAVYLGMLFYQRWMFHQWFSSYVVQMKIENILHMSLSTAMLICSSTLSCISTYFIYICLQITTSQLPHTFQCNNYTKCLLSPVVASIIVVALAQRMLFINVLSMGYINFIWNLLIVLVVMLFLYCISGRLMLSVFVGAGIFMVISTINVYVYKFRQRLFEPVDVFSADTAINVLDNYSVFPVPLNLIIGWSTFVIMAVLLCYLHRKSTLKPSAKRRIIILPVCVISSVAILFYSSNLETYHWENEGARYNGYILDFVSKFMEISITKPSNYSIKEIDKLAEYYSKDEHAENIDHTDLPHIIVVMDEAFSDLSVIGEFLTNMEVMPYISSLKENTISGYALSSVYGGNTANSEYEFLTGNSMAWLSPNAVPYQQYIRSSSYSMVSYLKSAYNYKCMSIHPYDSSGWNRPAAYEFLGFDECYFGEDLWPFEFVRCYASDQSMFESLIEIYESHKENPLFLFGVTMQNHGGYKYSGENYTKSISLNDYPAEFPDVEQYLSLIHETDKAVEYLITYFQSVDEDVIIVFFGDHQPSLDEIFYETISGTTADTLDEQQKRHKVPFFIWANYDIEEEYMDCTSLNYLSSYVYEAAGLALPPYNKFLQDMEATIPSINAYGFYSLVNEGYIPFNEANEDEQSWLKLYEALQYNNVFDKKNHNNILFPISE